MLFAGICSRNISNRSVIKKFTLSSSIKGTNPDSSGNGRPQIDCTLWNQKFIWNYPRVPLCDLATEKGVARGTFCITLCKGLELLLYKFQTNTALTGEYERSILSLLNIVKRAGSNKEAFSDALFPLTNASFLWVQKSISELILVEVWRIRMVFTMHVELWFNYPMLGLPESEVMKPWFFKNRNVAADIKEWCFSILLRLHNF